MMKRLFLYSVVVVAGWLIASNVEAGQPVAQSTQSKALRERFEKVLRDDLSHAIRKDLSVVGTVRNWPSYLAEKHLVKALRAASPETRLEAAEILLKHAGKKYLPQITSAIKNLKVKNDLFEVRLNVLQMRLGDKKALKQLQQWAWLEGKRKRTIPVWWCPMHPLVQMPTVDKCPICYMKLVPIKTGKYAYLQREAQRIALIALAESGDKSVPDLARNILIGDAEPYWRMYAAYAWAKVSPNDGVPHFRIHLRFSDTYEKGEALRLAAQDLAQQCVEDFEALLKNPSHSPNDRVRALAGLLAVGRDKYLDDLRRIVKSVDTYEEYWRFGDDAIRYLAKFGMVEDVATLSSFSKTELKTADPRLRDLGYMHTEDTAIAILRLLDRLQRETGKR